MYNIENIKIEKGLLDYTTTDLSETMIEQIEEQLIHKDGLEAYLSKLDLDYPQNKKLYLDY